VVIVTEKEVNARKQIKDTVHESYKLNLRKREGVAAVLSCLLFVWRLTGYGDLRELMWPITLSLSLSLLSLSLGGFTLGSGPTNLGPNHPFT
jgi:hypothetical protein